MAVCNIFNELNKPTGTFLTFSQYAESMTNTNQKVIPSKFVVINIHKENLTNNSIPKILQDYYENGVAVIKNKGLWKNKYSKDLFWRTMFNHFIENGDIKYIGDINIQSYEEYGGTGYSEIYCYIPNEAKNLIYGSLIPSNSIEELDNRSNGSYIEGYEKQDLGSWGQLTEDIRYDITLEDITVKNYDDVTDNWYDNLIPTGENKVDLYTFNTIVVLYDVIDKTNNKVLQNNQPMGIYFTGLYDESMQEITNYVTKYISSQEIYDQGTSYGLRICTKHITASSSSIVNEIQISNDTKSELCYALSQMSQSQTKMDEVIDHTYNCVQNYKDLAAVFKNSKTNVPYIKLIDGKEHWFVNGRRVGLATIDNGEVEHVCGININAKIYDNNSVVKAISIKDLLISNKILTLKWSIKNGDLLLKNSEINNVQLTMPNGEIKSLSKTSEGFHEIEINKYTDIKYHQKIENYILTITLSDGQVISKNIGYILTFPSYIGLIKSDVSWNDYLMPLFGDNKLDDKLKALIENDYWMDSPLELVLENQDYIYNYTNDGYETVFIDNTDKEQKIEQPYHVCYIYPAININSSNDGLSIVSSYKQLTSIKDSRDLEYINDFEMVKDITNNKHPYIVGKFGESTVIYNVYIDKIPAFVKNYTLTFK